MNTRKTNATSPSSLKVDTVSGIVLILAGVVILTVSRGTAWEAIGAGLGFLLIGFGVPLISWRLIMRSTSPNIISVIRLMRREKLQNIIKDQEKGKELITKSFREWAQNPKSSTIKIRGVTLNLAFGNNGILRELLERGYLINPNTKKLQVLLLNPYSMNAITRSIRESHPYVEERRSLADRPDPLTEICQHTLDRHKGDILYQDFVRTVRNIGALVRYSDTHKIKIECRIYNALSPGFLLISDRRAITENLILSKKKEASQRKLMGTLPHLVYGKGEIKDSLESHFDYMWDYDSVPLEDFHEEVEEKYFEINRLFLLYRLQAEIWERQWRIRGRRSFYSEFDQLYEVYKNTPALQIDSRANRILILDHGYSDGGGALGILRDHPTAEADCVGISPTAIQYLEANISDLQRAEGVNYQCSGHTCDMLTFLHGCDPCRYSIVYANFSIIYMTKIKAIEVYRKIFDALESGGIFMLSLWTTDYFSIPIGQHGQPGMRPDHEFVRIPMTEDLRVLYGGSNPLRYGEIRRFYHGHEELLEEFRIADGDNTMDLNGITFRYHENKAILRVWLKKK